MDNREYLRQLMVANDLTRARVQELTGAGRATVNAWLTDPAKSPHARNLPDNILELLVLKLRNQGGKIPKRPK